MKKVTVNDQHMFEIDGDQVNGEAWTADLIATGDRFFHLLHNGRSYTIEVLEQDAAGKFCVLRINGRSYTIGIQDPIDQLLDQMGLSAGAAGKMQQLKAPMPGLVLDIRVKAGDSVQKGDPLMVLEAMKMENVLKAEGEGVVRNILVNKGQNVEKGLVMMEFE